MTNRTQVGIATPDIHDEPTAYLNTARSGNPFAVVEMGTGLVLYIHEAAHARAIAAAFTKAADLLDDHAAAQGGQS